MPDLGLAALRALAEKATAGPWKAGGCEAPEVWSEANRLVASCSVWQETVQADGANADYIAALSPDVVLALLDRLERAEADVRQSDASYQIVLDDLRDLLDALGLPSGARPQSPHEVMREAIAEAALQRGAAR